MDEKALLNGARYLGYIFLGKDSKGNLLLEKNEEIIKFELLNIIEFDSKRKRMSVIVKDLQTNKIILFCKGADKIIRNLTTQNIDYLYNNEKHINELSSKGLRNLNIAYKFIEEKDYIEWDLIFRVKKIY
jgi:magnesium-transporting ATPase (P-type)